MGMDRELGIGMMVGENRDENQRQRREDLAEIRRLEKKKKKRPSTGMYGNKIRTQPKPVKSAFAK